MVMVCCYCQVALFQISSYHDDTTLCVIDAVLCCCSKEHSFDRPLRCPANHHIVNIVLFDLIAYLLLSVPRRRETLVSSPMYSLVVLKIVFLTLASMASVWIASASTPFSMNFSVCF